jgi:hypothetical protein
MPLCPLRYRQPRDRESRAEGQRRAPERFRMRCVLAILLAASVLAGCHKGSSYNADEVRHFIMPSPLLRSRTFGPNSDTPEPWPTFKAMDYLRAAHPMLTSKETAEIRMVLSEIKPCQRAGLLYGFPPHRRPQDDPMVVFFQIEKEERENYRPGHVFGTNNVIYLDGGELAPTMSETSDQAAIDKEPCFK